MKIAHKTIIINIKVVGKLLLIKFNEKNTDTWL